MHGIAKYASRCSWVFHMNVPTRSPDSMPRPAQRRREPVDPVGDLGERGAAAGVALEGDDLAVAVDRAPVAEDHADGQRESPASSTASRPPLPTRVGSSVPGHVRRTALAGRVPRSSWSDTRIRRRHPP